MESVEHDGTQDTTLGAALHHHPKTAYLTRCLMLMCAPDQKGCRSHTPFVQLQDHPHWVPHTVEAPAQAQIRPQALGTHSALPNVSFPVAVHKPWTGTGLMQAAMLETQHMRCCTERNAVVAAHRWCIKHHWAITAHGKLLPKLHLQHCDVLVSIHLQPSHEATGHLHVAVPLRSCVALFQRQAERSQQQGS